MNYEKQILPLDDEGHFLLAVNFPSTKSGGEILRESRHAYFALGHLDSLDKLTDITSLCCIERAPSPDEARKLSSLPVAPIDASVSEKSYYGRMALEHAYEAELALSSALFVPRKVMVSKTGLVIVGLVCFDKKGESYAVQKVINAFTTSVLSERSESRWPEANKLSRPFAISLDGESIVQVSYPNTQTFVLKENRLSDDKELGTFPMLPHGGGFIAMNNSWLAANEDGIYLFRRGDCVLVKQLPLPKKVFPWSVIAEPNQHLIAFSGDQGRVSVVDITTGLERTYFPHPGCKRDDMAQVKLSQDGKWMATRIYFKSPLIITRLIDGKSWKVAGLEDESIIERHEGDFKSVSFIPAAFNFIDSCLLVSENRGIRKVDIKESENEGDCFISLQGMPGARVPLKITPKANLEKLIKVAKLEQCKGQLEDFYYPALKLQSIRPKKSGWYMPDKKGAPALGESRLGGWPDLPDGMTWPMWQGRPMGFLAQINLADVCAVEPGIRLPKEGLLLFFLGCEDLTYENDEIGRETYLLDILVGSSPDTAGGWKVIYVKPQAILQRTSYEGEIAPSLARPCMLKMTKGGMPLPHEMTAAYNCLEMTKSERDNYNQVLDVISEEYPVNQLSGYPNLLQYMPPELYSALASSGRDPYSLPLEDSDENKQMEQEASEWGLLLQLTSDDNPGFLWGDVGHFYFYGKRKDMEAGNFDNIWVYFEN